MTSEPGPRDEVEAGPRSSVLICTRNRPDDLVRVVGSILADPDPGFEVIVVDQSDGTIAQDALRTFADDHRLRYVRSARLGKGAAMNEGLRAARAPVVVCTDDDCEATVGWVGRMTEAITSRPQLGLVFCRVDAPPHDHAAGYVPQYGPDADELQIGTRRTGHHRGLGAGLAVRRDVLLGMGGVDESFGPGALFPSADDWDLEVRMLLKGYEVLGLASVSILHHGFRTYEQGREHTKRDWYALGGAAAKPVRAGHIGMLRAGLFVFAVDAVAPILSDVVHLRRVKGAQRVLCFVRGFAKGMMTPVDRTELRYRREAGVAPRQPAPASAGASTD